MGNDITKENFGGGGTVRCPGFGRCQTMVPQAKSGEEHKYQTWDASANNGSGGWVYKTCSGS
jgi:hypothetical protein